MKLSVSIIGLAVAFSSAVKLDRPSQSAIESIRAEDVRRHIDFLASDSLMGRDTPSEGLDIAAEYIAKAFKGYGLKPIGGSYFQQFNVDRVFLGEKNVLQLTQAGKQPIVYKIKQDYMPYEFTANKAIEAELVFAGYGISAPEHHYDDYEGLDVRGKVVLILKHEPGEKDENSVFDGADNSPYADVSYKVDNAIEHGAAALLLITDPLNHRSIRPRGFPWPSLYKNIPNEAVPLSLGLLSDTRIPTIQVGEEFAEAVFGSVDSLVAIQRRIDAELKPRSFAIADKRVLVQTSTTVESATTQNVVALWPGTDPELQQQAVIIGAHYDHVGIKTIDVAEGEDFIYNGADDNASGTVGLLEVAEAYSHAEPPKRSVIFIAFAGEEKGLYGSKYYVEKPLWPLAETKAMFNMDMIGRNDGDKVTIIGYSKSPDLNQLNTEENLYIGLKLEYNGEHFFARSDQLNFAKKNIPVLFYNTGTHPDYHKVGDNPEKINEGKIAMISKLVFRTTWRAANTDQEFSYIDSN